MQQQKKTSQVHFSRWRYLAPIVLGAVVVFVVVQQASAGPITNPMGAPFAKLNVYQGLISIVPAGGQVMEIGNVGQDIASSGDIYLRPGSLSTVASDYARFYKDASAANKVSLSIPGKLCLAGDCKAAWPTGASGPITKHSIGNLSANALVAKRFEIALIGYDRNGWSLNSSIFVELHQNYWDAGGYKKYEVRAGYTDDGSFRLLEATGPNASMIESRMKIGDPVANGACGAVCLQYLPVYIDIDYYTAWNVIVSHSMAETTNAIPAAGQVKIYDFPPAVGTNLTDEEPANVNSIFTENDIVTHDYTNKFTGNILVNNQASNAQSVGVASGSGLGAGSYAFLMPYTAVNGAYNNVTRANDSGLFFSDSTGFTMGGWNAVGTIGVRLSGANYSDPNPGPNFGKNVAALAVNNGAAGMGGAYDALVAFANHASPSSAIYGEQGNASGFAAYFSGQVAMMNGNVGMGTSSPNTKLHVIGAVCVESSDSGCAPAAGQVRGTQLCIAGDCRGAWPSGGGALDSTLTLGNKSDRSIILGQGTGIGAGGGLVDAANTALIDKDGISGKSSRLNRSGVYGENSAGGWAGYYSGLLNVSGGVTISNTDPAPDLGSPIGPPAGALVLNANDGSTIPTACSDIDGVPGNEPGTCIGNYGDALDVYANTGTAGYAIYAEQQGTGFGIYARATTGYAGFFAGKARVNGNLAVGAFNAIAKLDVLGSTRLQSQNIVLSGTVSTTGASTAVNGFNTLFTTEIVVGDRITIGAQTRTVMAVNTLILLTVDSAFPLNTAVAATRVPAILTGAKSGLKFVINDVGSVGIGNTNPIAKLVVNNGLAGTGSAGDGLAAYANNVNSAVFGEQQNLNGYAGYFQNTVGGSAGWFQGAVHIYGPSTYDGFASGGTLTVRDTNVAAGSMAFRSESVNNGYAAYLTTNPASGTYPTLYAENKYSPGGFNIGKAAEFNGRTWFTSDNVDVSSYDGGATDQYKKKFLFAGNSPTGLLFARNYGTGPSFQAVQNNATSLAGDFWGDVDINGNVKITGDLTYKGRLKPAAGLQVCEVGSDVCLGQYLSSTGTTRDASATGIRYLYTGNAGSFVFTAIVFSDCPAGFSRKTRSEDQGRSFYTAISCGGSEYWDPNRSNPIGFGGTEPFRIGDQTCTNNTSTIALAQSQRLSTPTCSTTGGGVNMTGRSISPLVNSTTAFYELR